MALPPIEVSVRADTAQAEAALDRVGDRATATGARVQSGAGRMAASTTTATRSFSVLGGQSRMLTQQLSQVAQQATATGQVGQALAVQAADIGLAFGTVGTVVGALAGIALPSLIRMFSDTGDEAIIAEDALDDFASAMNRVDRAAEIGSLSIAELREEYGQFAEQVQFAARVVAQAALADGMREFTDVAEGLSGRLSGVSGAMAEYQRRVEILNTVQDTLGEKTVLNAAAYEQYESAVDDARAAVVAAAGDLGLTVRQAELLQGVLDRMAAAEGPEQIATQAGYALEIFDGIFTTASNIPPEVAALVSELRSVQLAASQAAMSVDDLAESASALPMSSGGMVGPGLGISAGMVGGQMLPPGASGDGVTSGSGRRGGRAARGRTGPRDTTADDLARLQEQLMTETELAQAAYDERLEVLRQARENQLLTQQEYNELEQSVQERHLDEMARMERAAQMAKVGAYAGAFGDLASLMQSSNKRLQKIGEAAAKAQITLEGVQSASSAWQKGMQIGGPPVAAAFAALSAIKTATLLSQVGRSGGGVGGGGGIAAPQVQAQPQGPQLTREVTIIGDSINRQQAFRLAEFMNEGTDNGLILR